GFLTLERFKRLNPVEDLWMFATGTGLAPYLSMLRDAAVWTRFRHIVLAVSLRERQDLAYEEELHHLAESGGRDGRATFVACRTLTRDHQHGSLSGRIPALIEDGQLQAAAGIPLEPATARVMLCGNPEMVETMRSLLKARGFRMHRRLEPGHIIVENYW
ncbi:MAG TPA: ferredoxin--NADP reductase, partial [Usitatibacteraceae bacterium]|nr:ferredoxin--NADP reductase [Usitatibacteraceae bacterium]